MKLLVIASRELAEHKLAWAAAFYVALPGLVLPLVKGPWSAALAESRNVLGVGLVFGFVAALAAVLGASLLSADLASGRIGFYLARPVSAGTILAGRFLGAWILAAGGGLVVALPLVFLSPRDGGDWLGLAAFASVAAVYILLLAHVAGTSLRSRSPWLLLDLATLALFLTGMETLIGRIAEGGAWEAVPWFIGGAALAVLAVLVAAVALQLGRGGADLRRGHRVLSLALAAGLAAVLLAGAAFSAWVRTGSPASLSTFHVAACAPRGAWLTLAGEGRFHRQAFLLNAATGEALASPWWGCFSPDGTRFVSVEPGEGVLRVSDTDLGAAPVRRGAAWDLPCPGGAWVTELRALSADGSLAVVVAGDGLLVADLRGRRVLHQERGLHDRANSRFVFPSAKVVREYTWVRGAASPIRELDLATGLWTVTGRVAAEGPRKVDALGRRLTVLSASSAVLCEGRTGEVLARIPVTPGGTLLRTLDLEDGGAALLERGPSDLVVRAFDAGGRERWSRTVPDSKGQEGWLVPEPGTGRFLLGLLSPGGGHQGRILAADPARGALEVVSATSGLAEDAGGRVSEGPLAARLWVGNAGGLVLAGPGGRGVLAGAKWKKGS